MVHYVWQSNGDVESIASVDGLRDCVDISIVQARPDDADEILALQKMVKQN
jgi:hypothetical protein